MKRLPAAARTAASAVVLEFAGHDYSLLVSVGPQKDSVTFDDPRHMKQGFGLLDLAP